MARKKTENTAAKQTAKEKRRREAQDVAEKGPESVYYLTWLRGHLRQSFRKWPSYRALSMSTPTKKLRAKDKRGVERLLKHKQCSMCQRWFRASGRKVAQDHITPVGALPNASPEAVGQFVLNLFCRVGNLRYLCSYTLSEADSLYEGRESCHHLITHGERKDDKKASKRSNRNKRDAGRNKDQTHPKRKRK